MPQKLLWRGGKLVLELEAVIRVPILLEPETVMQRVQREFVGVRLTPRERETLQCVREGLADKEIAARLNLSVRTVKLYVSNLLHKFKVDRRWKLTLLFREAHAENKS